MNTWAEYEIPKKKFNLAKAAKTTRNLTPEQREAYAERARANLGNSSGKDAA